MMLIGNILYILPIVSFLAGFLLLSVVFDDLKMGILGITFYIFILSYIKINKISILILGLSAYAFWLPIVLVVLAPYTLKFMSYGAAFLLVPLFIPLFLCLPFLIGCLFSEKPYYILLNPLSIISIEYINRYGFLSNNYIIPWSSLIYFNNDNLIIRNEYLIGFIVLSVISFAVYIINLPRMLYKVAIFALILTFLAVGLDQYIGKHREKVSQDDGILVNIIQTHSSMANYAANFSSKVDKLIIPSAVNILPESSYPYKTYDPYVEYANLYKNKGSVISGVIRNSNGKSYNSALYINNGKIMNIIDKTALVPIIETSWLSGPKYIDDKVIINGKTLSVFICFEIYLEKKYSNANSDIIVVLANNNSQIGLKFQLLFEKMRAKSLNTSIVFASNDGGSVFINHDGEFIGNRIENWGHIQHIIYTNH